MGKIDIPKIQNILTLMGFDGWLLYDFRGNNDLALGVMHISPKAHLTRRIFYFIPANGTPVKMVNGIEAHNVAHLPGEEIRYSSHVSLTKALEKTLKGHKKIACEYSPMNAIPYVSKLDAGTVEFLRQFNVELHSSANLTTLLSAIWTEKQYTENKRVAKDLLSILHSTFGYIRESLLTKVSINEYSVQEYILNNFKQRGMWTDHEPNCSVNENSANPHYSPTKDSAKQINKGDFILIDLWAKTEDEDSVWSDITWVAHADTSVPDKYINVFDIVKNGRDASYQLLTERLRAKKDVAGYELDDAAREVISKAGYGEAFIHRTGHSITTELHGSGPHLDNFETKDERLILPGVSFSIEPGIYLRGDFGIRSEIDVYVDMNNVPEITGGDPQQFVPALLA